MNFIDEYTGEFDVILMGIAMPHMNGLEAARRLRESAHRDLYVIANSAETNGFSSFGTFSASRTPLSYFQETIQSDEFDDYPIAYWYAASGAFDFGLKSQIDDYDALLPQGPRLIPGENTAFDVCPMRYHSMGNWHLALYDLLRQIF